MNGATAVIIAATHPLLSLGSHLAGFRAELGPGDRLIVVTGSFDFHVNLPEDVRIIRRRAGSLAPELWRDGLLQTDAPFVAFTTAQMVPRPGWLARLKARLIETGAAGVGGPIEPGRHLWSTDRAVALLRYSRYFPPLFDLSQLEPPGDNALYRRDRLMEVEPSWSDGFWEIEVHKALRDHGNRLAFDDSAVVTFEGGIGLGEMLGQRLSHARKFGQWRSEGLGLAHRMSLVALTPMVPPLLLGRILLALRTRKRSLIPWLPASVPLGLLASAWAIGQALGTLSHRRAAPGRSQPAIIGTGKA